MYIVKFLIFYSLTSCFWKTFCSGRLKCKSLYIKFSLFSYGFCYNISTNICFIFLTKKHQLFYCNAAAIHRSEQHLLFGVIINSKIQQLPVYQSYFLLCKDTQGHLCQSCHLVAVRGIFLMKYEQKTSRHNQQVFIVYAFFERSFIIRRHHVEVWFFLP